MASEQTGDNVRAVNRALDVLLAFTANDGGLTVGELMKRVDLRRSTLYRLLYTLEQKGFLTSDGEPQKFRLGTSVAHLAHVWTSSLDISAVAWTVMRRIWETTGETVALSLPRGADRRCVAEIPSSQPLSFKRGVGYIERLAVGASGHAILASSNPTTDELKRLTQGLNINLQDYEKELVQIRRRGYAISREELIPGAVAVAASFFNGDGQVAGSIGVFGPTIRMDDKRIKEVGQLLLQESENPSRALGLRRA